jgi:hypothetical protein
MRRGASIIFLVLGGFCVGMQVMIAFIAGGGTADYAGRLAYFTAIAIPFLALGTWLSTGRRWRALGLAMLIGAGVCVASFGVTIFLPDEGGEVVNRAELTPYLALVPGFVNLALIIAAGALLYVRGGGGKPTPVGKAVRGLAGEISVAVRASANAVRRK